MLAAGRSASVDIMMEIVSDVTSRASPTGSG